MKTAKNADIAEIPSKTKEYLNEKNAVDEECDKKFKYASEENLCAF